MMGVLEIFPKWKEKNVTAAERFDELSSMARKNPERFTNVLVVFEEKSPDGRGLKMRYITTEMTVKETLGTIELAKEELLELVRKGRS